MFVGSVAYIIDTLRGKTKPNRMTWSIWAIAPLIAASAALSSGVTLATVPVFVAGTGPLLILIASFANPKAYWKLEKLDYACGFFSLLALVLWGITKQPDIAIAFAIFSDVLAAVPTLMKMWRHPETETVFAYITMVFGASTSFAAINVWIFPAYAFPAYLVILNASLILIFYRGRIARVTSRHSKLWKGR